jgi:hypothetical protein
MIIMTVPPMKRAMAVAAAMARGEGEIKKPWAASFDLPMASVDLLLCGF